MGSYYVDKEGNYYRYKEDRDKKINIVSTAKQREEWHNEAVWKRLENGRLNDLNGYTIPGPNANDKDWKEYGANVEKSGAGKTRPHLVEEAKRRGLIESKEVKPAKIMPDDPRFTAAEKAANWASEAQHGQGHVSRWNRVAAALGVDNGFNPMSAEEIEKWWHHHNKNKRWTVALEAVNSIEAVEEEAAADPLIQAIEEEDWPEVARLAIIRADLEAR